MLVEDAIPYSLFYFIVIFYNSLCPQVKGLCYGAVLHLANPGGFNGSSSPWLLLLWSEFSVLTGSEALLYLSANLTAENTVGRTNNPSVDAGRVVLLWRLAIGVFTCGWPPVGEHMDSINWSRRLFKTKSNNSVSGSWTQVTRLE